MLVYKKKGDRPQGRIRRGAAKGGTTGRRQEADMYRSVTESKSPREGRYRALNRMEGVLIGAAIFLGVFFIFGWFTA